MIETEESLIVAGERLAYKLIRSKKRKKSIAMKLNRHGVLQINVPYKTCLSVIEEFIVSKYDWIAINRKKRDTQKDSAPLSYHDGDLHFYKGVQYPLQLISTNLSKVELRNNTIDIYHRKRTSIKNLLNGWYKHQALVYFKQRTDLFMNNFQLPKVKNVKVRKMKARWGSCNSRAEITYNTLLIKANVECIDYVVIHELCHLVHPNHGKGFYKLQSELNPMWKQHKALLDQQNYQFIN